jgi:hypothetical protein
MSEFIDDIEYVQILAMADLGGDYCPPKAVVNWVADLSVPPSDEVMDWIAAQRATAEEAVMLIERIAPYMSPAVVLAEGFPRWADQWWVIALGMPWAGNLRAAVAEAKVWL